MLENGAYRSYNQRVGDDFKILFGGELRPDSSGILLHIMTRVENLWLIDPRIAVGKAIENCMDKRIKAIPREKRIRTFLVDWIGDTAGSGETRIGFGRRDGGKMSMTKLKIFQKRSWSGELFELISHQLDGPALPLLVSNSFLALPLLVSNSFLALPLLVSNSFLA